MAFQAQGGGLAKGMSSQLLSLALPCGRCSEHCGWEEGVGGEARDGGLSAAAPLTLE